jgi:hypothetical protein
MVNGQPCIEVGYSVYFTTEDPVPISQIVESLLAYEKLLHRTSKFVERAYEGIKIERTDVLVQHIESGSLKEHYIVKFFVKDEADREKLQELVNNIMADSSALKLLIAAGVGAYIGFGLKGAIHGAEPTPHIEAYENTIINIGAEIDFSAEDFEAVLSGVRDKKSLAKESVEAVRPAKNDPNATIEVSGITSLTMPPKAIAEAPSEYEREPPHEFEKHFDNRVIEIYASDRDKQSAGWAGSVPGIVDKRVKFDLWDEVVPSQLHGKTRINADITVLFRHQKGSAEYLPAKVEVRRVHLKQ